MSKDRNPPTQDMGVEGREAPGEETLEVHALAAGGRGVARSAGRVWFLPGTVPGDRVRARPVRDRGRWIDGRVHRWVERSPGRREPPCPAHPACGGCPWMALGEGEQRRWKGRLVADALTRIGGLELGEVRAEPVGQALGYRNRVEFAVDPVAGVGYRVGLRASEGDGPPVEIERCLLLPAEGGKLLEAVRDVLGDLPPPAAAGTGELRLVLRRSETTGEWLVLLREAGAGFPAADELAARLSALDAVVGVVRIRTARGRRGGARVEILAGRDRVNERIAGWDLALPAATFVQVSVAGAERLLDTVLRRVGDPVDRTFLDLYAGVGLHGLTLARAGARLVRIHEADPDAVACGQEAARAAGLGERVRFVRGDVARSLERESPLPDLAVTNPPRGGMSRAALERLVRTGPRRIVYVSCDPATLARDVARLAAHGYRAGDVEAFDLFPQTAHVETVVTLERDGPEV